MIARHRPTLAALVLLATALSAALAGGRSEAQPAPTTETFVFPSCNRTFQQLGGDLAPVRQGAMTIGLSSPRHQLRLFDHRLEMTPLADGTHRARFVAEFAGDGDLVADVDLGGMASRLEDSVVLPRQTTAVDARVRLGHGDQGYEIIPVELPETVELRIRSQLAGRFATLCDTLTLVPGMVADCDALRAALSRARVPMPEPGETYLLPEECLDDDVRLKLDLYLDRWAR